MSGKKFTDATKKFDRDQLFTPVEALALAKSLASAKFDETVEFAARLGVDPRKADQMVRGTVALPSGTGKDVRVAVFANGEAAQAARDAGAEFVGSDDLAAEIEKGMMNFDVAIAIDHGGWRVRPCGDKRRRDGGGKLVGDLTWWHCGEGNAFQDLFTNL